ncbi:hypothetical protein RhiLY_01655 [Ceratobasidium sp. AG-Ba]|nr:hypothetical protein RhiLY_01655 [Ceratobasidium sp. AG-Ba]
MPNNTKLSENCFRAEVSGGTCHTPNVAECLLSSHTYTTHDKSRLSAAAATVAAAAPLDDTELPLDTDRLDAVAGAMASSQAQTNPSPRPAHTAGPSTASSSTTSPTGTHSTVATTVGGPKPRSWDEDKSLNLYILDYCRRRKFDDTALAFEREAKISRDVTAGFEAPQGLLFEWWIVFWETFNSQMSMPPREQNSGAHGDSSSQVYVNTMARLRKLAAHEKEELTRSRAMSMSMGTPAMSTTSMPGMGSMPAPGINGTMRPLSQASARSQSQQPGMPPAPGPQQMRPQPQPGMMHMQMTPNMAHTPTHTASTPTPAPTAPSPSPAPTPPQSFGGPGSGPGSSQQPFNSGSSQPSFGGPGGPQPGGPPPPPGAQPGGPPGGPQPMMQQGYQHPSGPGQPSFPGSGPGQFSGGGPGSFGPGGGAGPGRGQAGSFPPGNPGGSFPPPASMGPSPGGPAPGQFPPNAPGAPNFQPGGPGSFAPGGPFPGGPAPGQQFNPRDIPEWGERPPPQGREPWQNGRPIPAGMVQKPPGPGQQPMHPQMRGPGGPINQRFAGQPGMPGGPQGHMGGPPNHSMGGPPGQQQMGQSPKDGSRSNTPAGGWNPSGDQLQQQRATVAAQGGQVGPSGPAGRQFMGPGMHPGPGGMGPQGHGGMGPQGPGGMGPQGPGGMQGPGMNGPPGQGMGGMGPMGQQGPGGAGQKRSGSPPPPPSANMGGSPPDPKRPRPDPGPGTLQDSRPTSSKGPAPFGVGGQQPMHGGPGGHPGMMNGQMPPGLNEYKQEISHVTRQAIVKQGAQPAPFGPGAKSNGGQASEPRQVTNVKSNAMGTMGPPASPSLTNRGVGGVKKSESANSSPALSHPAANGMTGDRSRTPSSAMGKAPSPRPGPATRPQSATPTMNNVGTPNNAPPPPPSSAPPSMLGQSPSNGMLYPRPGPGLGQDGTITGGFDLGTELDFAQLTSEFLPEDIGHMFDIGSLNDWPGDTSLGSS